MKKLVFLSPPFFGHYIVFHRIAEQLKRQQKDIQLSLIYLTWLNIDISSVLRQKGCEFFDQIYVMSEKQLLTTTDPNQWCAQQKTDLGPALLKLFHTLSPDTVIYDSFVWGYQDWKSSFPKIRFICSLSGFLEKKEPTETKLKPISDGFYEEADLNIVWGVSEGIPDSSKYFRLGYPIYEKCVKQVGSSKKKVVLSLGTVILSKYMWEKNASVKDFVMYLFFCMVRLSRQKQFQDVEFIVVTSNIDALNDLCSLGGHNLIVRNSIDQLGMLQSSNVDVLITHGGNNSIQEAVFFRVPLLVIPFFGDQHATAKWVEANGLGKSIFLHDEAHTHTSSRKNRRLNDLEAHLTELLGWSPARFSKTSQMALSPYSLFCNSIPFQPGDILLGCNLDRATYIREREGFKYFGFSEQPQNGVSGRWVKKHSHALLLDNYTDTLKEYVTFPVDQYSEVHLRLMEELRQTLDMGQLSDVVYLCCSIIDFLLKKGFQMHFILNQYIPELNEVTRKELIHLLRFHNRKIGRQVHFYHLKPVLHPINIYEHPILHSTVSYFMNHRSPTRYAVDTMLKIAKHPLVIHSLKPQCRVKHPASLIANLQRNNEQNEQDQDCFHDIFGWRMLTAQKLSFDVLEDYKSLKFSEDNHVLHVQLDEFSELQIWTLVMYAGLAMEHGEIYKRRGFLTEKEQTDSVLLRKTQRQLQFEIDQLDKS